MKIKRKLLEGLIKLFSNLISDKLRCVLIAGLKKNKEIKYKGNSIYISVTTGWEVARADNFLTEEPETISWIEEELKPGDVLFDIGANIGVYSLVAARHSKGKSRIYSFEPNFLTFKSLCENISLNDYKDSIIPLHMPLSNITAIDKFHYGGLSAGDSMHAFGKKIDMYGKPHQPVLSLYCQSYRIDDLIEKLNFDKPKHLKIDVDGIEFEILSGAVKTLKGGSIRSILVETNEAISSAGDILRLLNEYGFILSAKNPRPTDHKEASGKVFNYVFKKKV